MSLLVLFLTVLAIVLPVMYPSPYTQFQAFINKAQMATILYFVPFLVMGLLSVFGYYLYRAAEFKKKNYLEDCEKDVEKSFTYLGKVLYSLDSSIAKYNATGVAGILISLFSLLVFSLYVFKLFEDTFGQIEKMPHLDSTGLTMVIILIILRASLIGSLIITFIVYSFKFATSSFDQAVRFTKRKHATLFLLHMMIKHDTEHSLDNMDKIMATFRDWNVNVESAYTGTAMNEKMANTMFEQMVKLFEAAQKINTGQERTTKYASPKPENRDSAKTDEAPRSETKDQTN